MRQWRERRNPAGSQGSYSLFTCFLFVSWFPSLKDMKGYFSKRPVFLTPLYTTSDNNSPRRGIIGEREEKITNKVEKKNVLEKNPAGGL